MCVCTPGFARAWVLPDTGVPSVCDVQELMSPKHSLSRHICSLIAKTVGQESSSA